MYAAFEMGANGELIPFAEENHSYWCEQLRQEAREAREAAQGNQGNGARSEEAAGGQVAQATTDRVRRERAPGVEGAAAHRTNVAGGPVRGVSPVGDQELLQRFLRDSQRASLRPEPGWGWLRYPPPSAPNNLLTQFEMRKGVAWRRIQMALSHYR